MSENLVIKEGAIGRKFSPVDRLRINNQGGGNSLWRNSEEYEIDSLSVTENGLYLALEDELYAYDVVTVDVQEDKNEWKKVTGKDIDLGDDVAVGVDEDGNLTEERIPDAIEIVVPPTKKKYVEGDSLSFSGIKVYLKYSGGVFTSDDYPTGEIPFDELIFPETIANADDSYGKTDIEVEGTTIKAPVYVDSVTQGSIIFYHSYDGVSEPVELTPQWEGYSGVGTSVNLIDRYYLAVIAGEDLPRNPGASSPHMSVGFTGASKTINGKTAKYITYSDTNYNTACLPESAEQQLFTSELGKFAWALVYGWEDAEGGTMQVPVQWMRPEDGEILEDTFEIKIVPDKTPEPEPEPEPDPYADHYDFEYQGAKYNFNRSDIRGMSYSGGYVLVMYMDTMQTYTVADALKYNLIVRVSSTHSGGDF